jgi:acyl-CoA synthetase (AMP-forming)/AMP-acid ligase II
MNIAEFLAISSAIVPDREALVFERKRFTFAQLQERACRLANALSALGVGPGDRVAAIQVNCHEHVEAAFAAALLDAVYVPLNFRARAEELAAMVNDAEPAALLTGQRYIELVDPLRPSLKGVRRYVALEAPAPGWLFYDDLLTQSSPDPRQPTAADEELAVLLFTAGTTGSPKGVMLSHESFSSYILANVEPADPEVQEKNLLTVPLHHIAGLQAVMAAVYGGRTLVVQRQFEPQAWMELVQREQVGRAMLVPTMLKQLLDHPDFRRYNLSSLKVITYGAAPMPLEVIKRALRDLPGCRFINAFGQTETASTITVLAPDDHVIPQGAAPQETERRLKRLTSIGKPLPDVEVRIVDEDGQDVAPSQVGEIVARGPRVMKGYWKQEAATREALRGGWLYTGDLGYTDDEGYIYLAGRAKDFIKRGGEMVSPEEVERLLMSHPAVDDAAVIGVPDAEWGERVRAIVVLRPGAKATPEEIMEHCGGRLAGFKKPESVVFTDALPRNPLGKLLKRVLREQYGQPIKRS